MHRFALGILFAVVVAASRPVATGGVHDLLAVGVVIEEGDGRTRLALSVPTHEAVEAYDALLRSPARSALLQGTGVHAPAPSGNADAPRVVELVYYGVRSRDGRSAVRFDGTEPLPGADLAWRAARDLAACTTPVTASAARVLLQSRDVEAVRDALEALAAVRADVAVSEAFAIAGDAGRPPENRIAALRVLRSLGGRALDPAAFRRLASDPEPLVAAEAAR